MTASENNKRIAKNTGFLYLRTIIVLLVSLYTSRVVLDVLGIQDYGIYNVVGGFVVMFSFLNNAMAVSSQRFLTYELGRGNKNKFSMLFSTSLNIHILIALLILFFAETLGLWFVLNKLVIPADRIDAALWVFQLSILSLMFTVTQVPYNATIMAHERMNVFAYISLFDVILKLIIVYLLSILGGDKLKSYSILFCSVTLVTSLLYRGYCNHSFKTCRFHLKTDWQQMKRMLSFSSWNLFSATAMMGQGQGINILLNVFFGPTLNAARSIAFQVNSAMMNFVSGFQSAANPQITKYYAQNNKNEMFKLLYKSSRYSYFLLFLCAFPLLLEIDFVLGLWLKEIPYYTNIFCQLVLINSLIDCFAVPLAVSIQATGHIKAYQFTVSLIILLTLPVSYMFLKSGYSPLWVFYVNIFISLLSLLLRLVMLKRKLDFSIKSYFVEVLQPCFIISMMSVPFLFPLSLTKCHPLLVMFLSVIYMLIVIWSLGLVKGERFYICDKILRSSVFKDKTRL